MNLLRPLSALLLAALTAAPASFAQGSTAQKLAALKNLRDTGVLTDAEYQQRVAALRGAPASAEPPSPASPDLSAKLAALRNLRDTGVLTPTQYQQRVAALKAANTGGAYVGANGRTTAADAPVTRAAAPAHKLDPHTFGQPTVAHTVNDPQWGIPWGTVKLPPNWTLTSQVVHAGPNGCSAVGHGPLISMESPDKSFALTLFPALKSQWMQGPGFNMQQMAQQGCFVMRSMHAADFATKILLPKVHNGAHFQVISASEDPNQAQMASTVRKWNEQMPMLTSMNFQSERTVETAKVMARMEQNGQREIVMVSLTLACQHTRFHQIMANMPPMETADCSAYNVGMVKVPDDGSDPTKEAPADPNLKPFFAIQPNPAWKQRLDQVSAQENQAMQQQTNAIAKQGLDNIHAAGERADAMRKASNARSDAIMNNYENHRAAMDQVQQGQIDYLSSSHNYQDPTTGQVVNLSNQYNHTYFDGKGHALQTDSAYSPGVDWTEAGK